MYEDELVTNGGFISDVTLIELKRGERLRRKRGKKLIQSHGTRRIQVILEPVGLNDWAVKVDSSEV